MKQKDENKRLVLLPWLGSLRKTWRFFPCIWGFWTILLCSFWGEILMIRPLFTSFFALNFSKFFLIRILKVKISSAVLFIFSIEHYTATSAIVWVNRWNFEKRNQREGFCSIEVLHFYLSLFKENSILRFGGTTLAEDHQPEFHVEPIVHDGGSCGARQRASSCPGRSTVFQLKLNYEAIVSLR